MAIEKALFIQFDGKMPKEFTDEWNDNKKVCAIRDENKIPVYEASVKFVAHLISARPDRYRLYQSEPMDIKEVTESGAFVWKKYYPWAYRKVSVDVGMDPVTKARLFEDRIEWFEDTRCMTVKKRSDIPEDAANKIMSLELELKSAKASIAQYVVASDKYKATIESLEKRIESLESNKKVK